MFEYYDNDFARGRLLDTIIRIKDKAALITNVFGDQDLEYLDLESLDRGQVNIRSEDVNIVPPRLGYVSLGKEWEYFERDPVRRWKQDRKSTRLNSSHVRISYAVFCLKK